MSFPTLWLSQQDDVFERNVLQAPCLSWLTIVSSLPPHSPPRFPFLNSNWSSAAHDFAYNWSSARHHSRTSWHLWVFVRLAVLCYLSPIADSIGSSGKMPSAQPGFGGMAGGDAAWEGDKSGGDTVYIWLSVDMFTRSNLLSHTIHLLWGDFVMEHLENKDPPPPPQHSPTLQVRKQGLREVRWLACGHTGTDWV